MPDTSFVSGNFLTWNKLIPKLDEGKGTLVIWRKGWFHRTVWIDEIKEINDLRDIGNDYIFTILPSKYKLNFDKLNEDFSKLNIVYMGTIFNN